MAVSQHPDASAGDPALAIYIHWPFCRTKCPYCDFNSHIANTVDDHAWRSALLGELDYWADRVGRRRVGSIFFGGGTPSLMEPATAAALITRVGEIFDVAEDLEITLEANPTSVEAGRLAEFAAAGVNRASLGVQALDDDALAWLGREHSAREALDAVAVAANCFARYSFDLIYGRPGQQIAGWRDELCRAIGHARGHLSAYQLTIEPATPLFARHARGEFTLPDETVAAALFEVTSEELARAGLPAYEISNHAAPGEACRHNLAYWRHGDYVGVGPGAHGRLTLDGHVTATRQLRAPASWLDRVGRDGHATAEATILSPQEVRDEMVLMGLRMSAGIARNWFAARAGQTLEAAFDVARLGRLVDGGFIVLDTAGLRATATGRQRLDAVTRELLS